MATYTLVQYRRALARALDDLGVYIVSAATTTTVGSVNLADSTPNVSPERFKGRWVYGAQQQRRVQSVNGFTAASGTLAVNYPWAAPVADTYIEMTGLFPMLAQVPGEDTSYHDLVSRAMAKLLLPDRITVTITTADSLSLSAYPWMDRPERLVRVLEPGPTGTRPIDASWRGPQLIWRAGTPSLEFRTPFDVASGSVTLEVLRPADTLISGVETAPGTGFSLDAQTGIAPIEDVVTLGLMEAYGSLMNRNPGVPGNWAAQYADARERAERTYHFDGAFYKRRGPEEQAAA